MGNRGSKPPSEARVLMLGLDGAGKSTLLYKLKYSQTMSTVPTVGFNVEMLETRRHPRSLTVWDVGGQQAMRTHWTDFYPDVAGLVFVVDSSDQARLDEARREFERVLKSEQLKGRPVVIFANKQDVPGAMSAVDLRERLQLGRLCSGRDWFVQPCSAAVGVGLEDGFAKVSKQLERASENRLMDTVQFLKSMSSASAN